MCRSFAGFAADGSRARTQSRKQSLVEAEEAWTQVFSIDTDIRPQVLPLSCIFVLLYVGLITAIILSLYEHLLPSNTFGHLRL